MSFEFKISTNKIRDQIFDFAKSVYKKSLYLETCTINWIFGVYDNESGFFITCVKLLDGDVVKYIALKDSGEAFYVVAQRYRHGFIDLPKELVPYSDIIQEGLKLYGDEKIRKRYMESFTEEQNRIFKEIDDYMCDRCKPSVDIKSYEDAKEIFCQNDLSYYQISNLYNKKTLEKFNKYMSQNDMRTISGVHYKEILLRICSDEYVISDEICEQMAHELFRAKALAVRGIDDMYVDITFECIKKICNFRLKNTGCIAFIEDYMKSCIMYFIDKIQEISPLVDFIRGIVVNQDDPDLYDIKFYLKELDRLIYHKDEGFQFMLTTNKIRDIILENIDEENVLYKRYINWVTGVYDKESGIFLTQIKYYPDCVRNKNIEFYQYIVIMDDGTVFIARNKYEWRIGKNTLRIEGPYEHLADKVREGIAYYRHDRLYRALLDDDAMNNIQKVNKMMDAEISKRYERS